MKLLPLLPRLLSILAIGFVSIFALDAFDHGTLSEQLFDFMMHMIPTFVLIIILAIAWKWELIGGIIYVLLGIGISPLIYTNSYLTIILITFPFIISGLLFILSHFLRKKSSKIPNQ
jgi:hypothetical protein